MKLKQIAEIITGYQPRQKIDADFGEYPFVQQKDIDCVEVDINNFVKIDLSNPDRYTVRTGDMLQVIRGTRFSTFLIANGLNGCIFSGQFYRIRIKKAKVLPEYVYYYINSEATKKRIKMMARGSGIPMLPKDEIENLDIPIPNLETQRKVACLCRKAERENQIFCEIAEQRAKMISGIFANLKHNN